MTDTVDQNRDNKVWILISSSNAFYARDTITITS